MSLHTHRIENARRRRNLAEGWETVQRGLPTPAPADGVQTSHREVWAAYRKGDTDG